MAKMGKYLSLFLVVALAASSILIVKSTYAQSIPKPSVPEFTLKYADHSYDMQPTYEIDPYTGKETLKQAGHHAQNVSIVVNIKNQQFTPSEVNGSTLQLYYRLQLKGHFENKWQPLRGGDYIPASSSTVANGLKDPNSPTTVVVLGFDSNEDNAGANEILIGVPIKGKIDFQVQSALGIFVTLESTDRFGRTHDFEAFSGESSSWSNTETISLPDGEISISPSQNPTLTPSPSPDVTSPTPSVPEFPLLALLPCIVIVPFIAAVIKRKQKLTMQQANSA